MESPATLTSLLALLDAGEMLLLPNGRAAHELRKAYDAEQHEKGLSAWQPGRAISWQQWTSSLYSDLIVSGAEPRLLLNATQEQHLWSAIINSDPPQGMLTSNDSLAELAASAFQLAAAWNATSQLSATASSDDTRTFARWARAFEDHCIADRCLSAAMLDTALAHHLTNGTMPAADKLQLVGFDKLTPSQQQLLNAFQNRGAKIDRIKPVSVGSANQHVALTATNPREELIVAAHWLREQLTAAARTPRIAVLNPNLAEERAEFEAVLRDVLAPELQSIGADLSSTPWEFSMGQPLSALALIADALDLVRWSISALPQPRISALLLSPYLNPGEDRGRSAQLDANMRRKEKRLRPELSLDSFLRLLDRYKSPLVWPRQLATEIARGGDLTRPRTYAAWMDFLRGVVQATGWPSSEVRDLNATEYEATRAWDSVLDLVATLDFSGQRVSLERAIETLSRQAEATDFTPPSTNAPIQIMRPTEIEGALFDTVLFLHATDADLPVTERTHPLLAWTLQHSLNMPGTDAVRTAAQASASTQSLLDRTITVLFTAAAEDANGEIRPSPLLSELDITKLSVPEIKPGEEPLSCELVVDTQPLPPLPSAEVHGGSRLLQLQAACGFRAFAELRLNATEPDTADIGLDAMQSGNIVHAVLQQLWTRLESQAELAALSTDERRELLELCIADALREASTPSGIPWDEAYLSVIRERLLRLMTAWTEIELKRSSFVIQGLELEEKVPVGPLTLNVRLDRIDGVLQTEDGERSVTGSVLVDYKTGGSANPKQWNIPRPEEPQLPLYTLLFQPEEVKGLAFGKLIAGEDMRWLGMQSEAGILPGSRPRIDDLTLHIEEWRAELTQLAYDFANGVADVSPKDPVKTCQYCAQRILCRVNELNLTTQSDTDEDDSDE
jgi:probable DNA repair protein